MESSSQVMEASSLCRITTDSMMMMMPVKAGADNRSEDEKSLRKHCVCRSSLLRCCAPDNADQVIQGTQVGFGSGSFELAIPTRSCTTGPHLAPCP